MTSRLAIRPASHRLKYILPLALGLLTLIPIKPVLANEPLLRTLTVSGQGSEMVTTTLTQVQLGVEVQGEDAEQVQKDVAQRSNAVVELLRSRNVSKLQTTGIYLNPVYSYDNNTQRITGYSGTNTVSFEIPTEQAGSILDDAVGAGATRINGVSFIASDEAIAQAQRAALREATQEAQEQAEAVLSALGLRQQEIVGIQVNSATPPVPPPRPYFAAERAMADAAPTPVIGGEQEVQASVTLQIRY